MVRVRPVTLAAFFILFAVVATVSVLTSRLIPLEDWRSHLRADAAGYYIYLPGLFHHRFRATETAQALTKKNGAGFEVDMNRDRIVTKYTYGTALLQLPFYFVAEGVAGFGETDAWTRIHHDAIAVAGVFYGLAGLFALFFTLHRWQPAAPAVICVTAALTLLSTSLFFYLLRMPGFSHVYSFFLVSVALHCSLGRETLRSSVLQGIFVLASALIVIIRPVDVIAVAALYGIVLHQGCSRHELFRLMIWQIGALAILTAPQLAYWKYTFGSWIVYSYGDEGFQYLFSPKWREVLFAPRNGLFPNAPAFALFPLGIVVLSRHRLGLAVLTVAPLALILYLCMSWHAWDFGCSYGMRPLVQYVPFLAVSLWVLFSWLYERAPRIFFSSMSLGLLVAVVSGLITLQYPFCYTAATWDWGPFKRNIASAIFL